MYTQTSTSRFNTTVIITLLCLISSSVRFVIDSYLPSIPAISNALNVSGNYIQFTLTLYMLGFGISQLIYGPLSDRWGRKPILIAGLILFIAANIFCVFTHSLTIMLIARFIAGFGMGACGVLNRAIANDCFTGAAFSRAWAYTTTTLVFVLILAPIIGSIVQQWFDWRANLLIAMFYASIVLIIIMWKLPETNPILSSKKIELYTLWDNYIKILSTHSFVACTLCYTLSFAGLISYFQVSPLLFMQIFKLSPIQYGETSLLIAACYLLGGQIVKRLAHCIGTYKLLLVGILILIVSSAIMLVWNYYFIPNLVSTLIPIALYVVGARIVIPNALSGAFTDLRHLGGTTSSLIGGIQMLGTAFISFIVAHCSYQSPISLALILILLGLGCLFAFSKYRYSEAIV